MLLWNQEENRIACLTHSMKLVFLGALIAVCTVVDVSAFAPVSKSPTTIIGNSFLNVKSASTRRRNYDGNGNWIGITPNSASSTSLNVLLEVPEYFFTLTFPMLGILLSVSKGFARLRLEESAWEQRLEEARTKRLRDDPTLTELELRRKESSLEWSAYGKPRKQEEAMRERNGEKFSKSRRDAKVTERDDRYDDSQDGDIDRNYHMNDDEINRFEMEYGIEYDPYYDDPYAEEELPDDINFRVDKQYGDRIYETGEIFYKDKSSGMFYRQGAKPRNLSFW